MLKPIKNFLRGRVQKFGTPAMKRKLWDSEFASGHWETLENTAADPIYNLLEQFSNGGKILDLGCGSGNTGNELRIDAYSHYVGVDISQVAVEKAIARSKESGRSRKNTYVQGALETFQPSDRYDVILFRESIYYIPDYQRKPLLLRYSHFLSPSGVLLLKCYEGTTDGALAATLPPDLNVVMRANFANPGAFISVFSPSILNHK